MSKLIGASLSDDYPSSTKLHANCFIDFGFDLELRWGAREESQQIVGGCGTVVWAPAWFRCPPKRAA